MDGHGRYRPRRRRTVGRHLANAARANKLVPSEILAPDPIRNGGQSRRSYIGRHAAIGAMAAFPRYPNLLLRPRWKRANPATWVRVSIRTQAGLSLRESPLQRAGRARPVPALLREWQPSLAMQLPLPGLQPHLLNQGSRPGATPPFSLKLQTYRPREYHPQFETTPGAVRPCQ